MKGPLATVDETQKLNPSLHVLYTLLRYTCTRSEMKTIWPPSCVQRDRDIISDGAYCDPGSVHRVNKKEKGLVPGRLCLRAGMTSARTASERPAQETRKRFPNKMLGESSYWTFAISVPPRLRYRSLFLCNSLIHDNVYSLIV